MMRASPYLLLPMLVLSHGASPQAGEWNQADAHYDPERMAQARHAVQAESGGHPLLYFQADRLEYQSGEGDPLLLWDLQGWYGGDLEKLRVKSEGEYSFDEDRFEEAELQILYSRAISDYFDVQAGLRHDFEPGPSRTHAVIGVQGLAPYEFEVDGALFISEKGDVTARLELEYELFLTQRLVLQPRAELNLAFSDIPELDLGSGLTDVQAGARLRYEISRRFAPYVGVSWSRKLGETADRARATGDGAGSVSLVAGIRMWF
jgi:copper resistance protein B